MEFLILWVLSGTIMDSGLRYKDAGECFATAPEFRKRPTLCWAFAAAIHLYTCQKRSRASALSRAAREPLSLLKKAVSHPLHEDKKGSWGYYSVMVERTGIEPVTPTMSM